MNGAFLTVPAWALVAVFLAIAGVVGASARIRFFVLDRLVRAFPVSAHKVALTIPSPEAAAAFRAAKRGRDWWYPFARGERS